jgi:hypothetical protein
MWNVVETLRVRQLGTLPSALRDKYGIRWPDCASSASGMSGSVTAGMRWMTDPARLRVFVDAGVLMGRAASPNAHNASLVVLQMVEIILPALLEGKNGIPKP